MRTLRALGLVSLLAGLGLLAYAATTGDVRVGLFLVVPYVVGTGIAPFLGTMLIMAGLVMVFVGGLPPMRGWERDPAERSEGSVRSRSGGVVLLGPIPIVWGSDRRILPWMVGAGLLMTAVLVFLMLR